LHACRSTLEDPPKHQTRLGLRGMQGQGQVMADVVMPIHVGDIEVDFIYGRFKRHDE
jgi:hypothetical protein